VSIMDAQGQPDAHFVDRVFFALASMGLEQKD
jgi:hypothetical protein